MHILKGKARSCQKIKVGTKRSRHTNRFPLRARASKSGKIEGYPPPPLLPLLWLASLSLALTWAAPSVGEAVAAANTAIFPARKPPPDGSYPPFSGKRNRIGNSRARNTIGQTRKDRARGGEGGGIWSAATLGREGRALSGST